MEKVIKRSNELNLMIAVRDAIDALRQLNEGLRDDIQTWEDCGYAERATSARRRHDQMTAIIDMLRLKLKGRI